MSMYEVGYTEYFVKDVDKYLELVERVKVEYKDKSEIFMFNPDPKILRVFDPELKEHQRYLISNRVIRLNPTTHAPEWKGDYLDFRFKRCRTGDPYKIAWLLTMYPYFLKLDQMPLTPVEQAKVDLVKKDRELIEMRKKLAEYEAESKRAE